MSGGLRHHNDEENGPSHAVGYKSSKKQDSYSVERNQCVCAVEEVCPDLQKPEPKSLDRTGVVRDVVRSQRRSSDKISVGRIEIELVRAQRIRSGFHSYSSLKAQTSKADRIHGIACPDSLGDIEVILQVVNNVRCRASPLNGGKNLRVLRNRSVGEVTEIVVVISIGA